MTEIFIKMQGVTGTATGAHQGWLKVSSAQLPPNGNKSIAVSKVQDQVTQKLFKMANEGTALPTVTIDFVKAGRLVTRLELTDVVLGDFHAVSGRPPMESMALHYMGITTVLGNAPDSAAKAASYAWAVPKMVRS